MDILSKIKRTIQLGNGAATPVLLLNGNYVISNGSRVYVEIKNDQVKFFTVNKLDASLNTSSHSYLDAAATGIYTRLSSDSLFGYNVGIAQDPENATIQYNPDTGFLIIESEFYRVMRETINADATSSYRLANGEVLTSTILNGMRDAFVQASFINYRDVIYTNRANKFINILRRSDRFYDIKPESFVPVFIKVDGLFDPFSYEALNIKNSDMYKLAIQRNRHIHTGVVEAYYLTHLEICEALHMSNFMRFKCSTWYNIVAGLLQQGSTAFPNKMNEVVIWRGAGKPADGLRRTMTIEDFEILQRVVADGKMTNVSIDDLAGYVVTSSLNSFVIENLTVFQNTGPTLIDNNRHINAAEFQRYLSSASIW